jgi:hypothetical protein
MTLQSKAHPRLAEAASQPTERVILAEVEVL